MLQKKSTSDFETLFIQRNLELRAYIYKEFRSLDSLDEQRHFLIRHIDQGSKNRTTRKLTNSRRTFTNQYHLTANGEKKLACREFFMSTLNVTDALIRSCLAKKARKGLCRQTNVESIRLIIKCHLTKNNSYVITDHILSFPTVESHYCRKKSNKRYLDGNLNVSIMYRLYQEKCFTDKIKPASLAKYRSIFREYHLGFFRPKKDACKQCEAFSNLDEAQYKEQEHSHKLHLDRKEDARKCRNDDKIAAQENPDVLSFNFDLQAVLTTPKGPADQIFYMRKLAVYNLTIYNLGNQEVIYNLWDETRGNRGSNEISTCIFEYIMSHPSITQVRMMSDGCKKTQFLHQCVYMLLPNILLLKQ
nr:uncharacterized protein LOC111419935 [Onthophagus taurus]